MSTFVLAVDSEQLGDVTVVKEAAFRVSLFGLGRGLPEWGLFTAGLELFTVERV